MSDSELLELAARAAGIEHEGYTEHFFNPECYGSVGLVVSRGDVAWLWNPLADDGDAFRLMVDLGVYPVESTAGRWICIDGSNIEVAVCGDKHAATRRAVVLAAAGIAKSK